MLQGFDQPRILITDESKQVFVTESNCRLFLFFLKALKYVIDYCLLSTVCYYSLRILNTSGSSSGCYTDMSIIHLYSVLK